MALKSGSKKNFVWRKQNEDFLGSLITAVGISGNCQAVYRLLQSALKSKKIEVLPDQKDQGIFQAVLQPGKKMKVMVQAHMDAVGMRVSFIDDRGFVFVRSVGGIDLMGVKGQKVRILTQKGEVNGLVQGLPVHHAGDSKNNGVNSIDKFFIRTAYTSSQKNPISLGDPVVFDEPLGHLGDDVLIGPGFDNRLGCLMMTEILNIMAGQRFDFSLYGVASSGEEIGCRGIRAYSQKLDPDLAIVLDVTNATDYPGADHKKFGSQKMGEGPILAVGYNTRTKYNEALMEVARKSKIPFQLRAEDLTPTDGREIDEAGVPTLVIRIPGCMLHTANDCVHVRDIEYTMNLVLAFLKQLS